MIKVAVKSEALLLKHIDITDMQKNYSRSARDGQKKRSALNLPVTVNWTILTA